MTADKAVERRLRRALRQDYFLVVALDHALTYGVTAGIEGRSSLESLLSALDGCGVPSVVLNAGLLNHVSVPPSLHVFAQTWGMPSIAGSGRTELVSVDHALAAGADGIAVQIDVSHISSQIAALTRSISASHGRGYPVLLMVNGLSQLEGDDACNLVRSIQELGPDLVKVPGGPWLRDASPGFFRELLVPTLLAGGPKSENFWSDAAQAKKLGLAGVCVGRNLFQAPSVTEWVNRVDELFDATS